jgi:hypothetical protein
MDQNSLEDWLNTRPKADAITIAYRAALRVLPLIAAEDEANTFHVLRCVLTSFVAQVYPKEVRSAAAVDDRDRKD